AHELRTPVAVIKNHGDIMLRYSDMEDDERAEFLQTIVAECGRLAAMIQDLLFVETVEAGQVILSDEDVDLAALCEHFTALFRVQAEAKGMELRCEIAADLPRLRGDSVKLGQVVANLFGNAVKFSPPNSSVLCRIDAEGPAGGEFVVLRVEDEGPGVLPEHREFIFQKYAQIRDGSTEACEGMGLGLAIVREIVELHGGRVWVEARQPRGARFVVMLPSAPVGTRGEVARA
ncbi:MAG: HAMP domain-containing histidine kinase, partial [Myxococcales bacterium]|nr:HAMP domain-containing histidine kinase [Myxococcales bacterium]